jgi:hypothetical protein
VAKDDTDGRYNGIALSAEMERMAVLGRETHIHVTRWSGWLMEEIGTESPNLWQEIKMARAS